MGDDPQGITEVKVGICIEILQSYASGTLSTDQCDALDAAIEAAYNVFLENFKQSDHDWHDNPLDH